MSRKYRDAPDHRITDTEADELRQLESLAGEPPRHIDPALALLPDDAPVSAVMTREEYRLAVRGRELLPALLRELDDWRRGRM